VKLDSGDGPRPALPVHAVHLDQSDAQGRARRWSSGATSTGFSTLRSSRRRHPLAPRAPLDAGHVPVLAQPSTHRTIADEFFRASYSQGIYAYGTKNGFGYYGMLANNLSIARHRPGSSTGFHDVLGGLWWMPTPVSMGREPFGDYEDTGSWPRSSRPLHGQPPRQAVAAQRRRLRQLTDPSDGRHQHFTSGALARTDGQERQVLHVDPRHASSTVLRARQR
jgi:hypothetical protein